MTHYNHFQRGTGKYTCRRCKQATRDTGTGEAQHDLCAACYEIESYENEHSDDDHTGTIHDCKECRKHMTPKAQAKLDEENAAIKKAMPTTKLSSKSKRQAKGWEKVRSQLEEQSHQRAAEQRAAEQRAASTTSAIEIDPDIHNEAKEKLLSYADIHEALTIAAQKTGGIKKRRLHAALQILELSAHATIRFNTDTSHIEERIHEILA